MCFYFHSEEKEIMEFSTEDAESLIESVKNNPLLYDPQNVDYKNNEKRGVIWEQIAQTLNKASSDCQKKWKNLKDSYNRSSNKKTASGSGATSSSRNIKLSFLDSVKFARPKSVN